jgi:hypothetical protein
MSDRKKFKMVWSKGIQVMLQTSFALAILLLVPYLVVAAPVTQSNAWRADYFANQTLSGSPVLSRYDQDINFYWGEGSPGSGIPADNFSARWTRDEWFDNGTYRFTARSDDGLRVWVGEELVIDAWYDQQASWMIRDVYVSQGIHTVRVEYYEHGGRVLCQQKPRGRTGAGAHRPGHQLCLGGRLSRPGHLE